MTNREKITKMSTQELAEYLCVVFVRDCSSCIEIASCVPDGSKANGLYKWLEAEAEPEKCEEEAK